MSEEDPYANERKEQNVESRTNENLENEGDTNTGDINPSKGSKERGMGTAEKTQGEEVENERM